MPGETTELTDLTAGAPAPAPLGPSDDVVEPFDDLAGLRVSK